MSTPNPSSPVRAPLFNTAPAARGIRTYIGSGTVIKLVGRIDGLEPDGARHLLARLSLSFGEWPVRASVICIDADIRNGDWVCVRLQTPHDATQPLRALRVIKVGPAESVCSWLPLARYLHEAGIAELRRILFGLKPALQGFFAGVLSDTSHTESRLLARPAALDHHCYPGGLFDQTLAAARLAQQDEFIAESDRGLLTLATLLFDIGKVGESEMDWDSDRAQGGRVLAHRLTALRLARPLQRLARTRPALAAEIAAVLGDTPTTSQRIRVLRARLSHCVQSSWGDTSLLAIPPANRNGAF